jgi:hypothetical protein
LHASKSFAEDDLQYWSRYSVKLVDTKHIDFVENWELRLTDDWSQIGYWHGSHQLKFDFFEKLGFGLNYTYLDNESINSRTHDRSMIHQHRLEFEATPRYKFKNGIKFTNRNRYEMRWFQDQGSNHSRIRTLYELSFPIKNLGRIENVFCNNELLVDAHKHALNENRLIPIGVTIKLFGKNTLQVFYMIQSKKGTKDWSSNQVFGTQVSIAF